jgi:hypothetical protein
MNKIVHQNLEHIKEQLASIDTVLRKIDLANDSEKDLLNQLNIINKASYSAIQTIKADIQNR